MIESDEMSDADVLLERERKFFGPRPRAFEGEAGSPYLWRQWWAAARIRARSALWIPSLKAIQTADIGNNAQIASSMCIVAIATVETPNPMGFEYRPSSATTSAVLAPCTGGARDLGRTSNPSFIRL